MAFIASLNIAVTTVEKLTPVALDMGVVSVIIGSVISYERLVVKMASTQ
jgi:hypothetical protein